ncbi:MAG: hypothetical protein AB7Q69_02380 [Gemmatimonadales bacterium]
MADLVLRPLSIGELLDRSLFIFRRRFAVLLIITLICLAIPLALSARTLARLGNVGSLEQAASTSAMLAGFGDLLIYSLLFFVLNSVANAAIVFVVSEAYLGRAMGAGAALSRTLRVAAPVIVLAILQQVILLAGAVVLIPVSLLAPAAGTVSGTSLGLAVGGFILYQAVELFLAVSIFVSLPALVLEPDANPIGAMGRAWRLASGNRWRILGVLMVLGVITFLIFIAMAVVAGVIAGAASAGAETGTMGAITLAVMVILWVLVFSLVYCLQTVTYYDLRVRKEGFDLELLAANMSEA